MQPGMERMAAQVSAVPSIVRSLAAEVVWTRWAAIAPLACCAAVALVLSRRSRPLGATFLALFAITLASLVVIYWNARVGIPGLLLTSAQRVVMAPMLAAAVFLPLLLGSLRDEGRS
jgi:hypothetical protein